MSLQAGNVTGAFEKRRPGLEPAPLDPETSARTNHEATAPPTKFHSGSAICCSRH